MFATASDTLNQMTRFTISSQRSAQILTPELLKSIFSTYFGSRYLGHVIEYDRDAQRSGIDVWVRTPEGRLGIDLKACSRSVSDHLHLEVYSVREDRKIGYLLNREAKSSYLLYISPDGAWRIFSHHRLAKALRANFKNWADRFGVRVQETLCVWRPEGRYSSSTICVPTRWIRGAYYAQVRAA
jgi:hypothetical protein